jgi:hypothetical protein
MDMRMMLQFLIPGMKHTEEAAIASKAIRVARNFDQGRPGKFDL